MNADQRAAVLKHVSDGHDIEAAAVKAGVTMAQVRDAGAGFQAELNSAFRTGTARLRSRVMELAMAGEDAAMLARILDKRDEAQTRMAAPEPDEIGAFELARRLAYVIAKGADAGGVPVLVRRIVEHAEG